MNISNAIKCGDIDTIKKLLNSSNVNELLIHHSLKWSLIEYVIRYIPDESVLELLLEMGANVNYIDEYGNSALLSAGVKGNINNVKLLLKYGADPNINIREGYSIAYWVLLSSNSGSSECARLICSAGGLFLYGDTNNSG